jgi:hypothetical protein
MRRLTVVSFAFLAIALVAPASLWASCGSESCPLDHMSRWSEAPFTFELTYQYIDQDQPRTGIHDASVGQIPRDHDEVRTLNRLTTARASYRAGGAWSLSAALPWVDRYHEHIHNEALGESEVERFSYSGLGDLEVALHHSLGAGESRRRGFLSAGIKMPTGDTHVPNEEGEQPEPAARPGSGSWDILAGMGVEWQVSSRSVPLRWSMTGRYNGRGTEGYRIGAELQAHLGTEYPVTRALALLAQANLRVRDFDDVGSSVGVNEADTGGTVLYLSPGVRAAVSHHASIYALVQLPVYQRVNGIQVVSDGNLYVGLTGGF